MGEIAADGLSKTLLMFNSKHDVIELAKENKNAQRVVDSWTNAAWFTSKPELPKVM